MSETSVPHAILTRKGTKVHRVLVMLAPGVDVRMTQGRYRGQTGYVVGFRADAVRGADGWEVFLPKLGITIVTTSKRFTGDGRRTYTGGKYVRKRPEKKGAAA